MLMHKNRWLMLARTGLIHLNQPPADSPGGGNPPVPQPPANPPAQPPQEPKTFDQDHVSAIAAREHDRGSREGKRQAQEELLQRLGIQSVDDVDNIVALARAAKEADEKNMTQAQKDAAAAETARKEAEADRAAAKQDRHAAALERILTGAGMPVESQAYITVPGIEVGASAEDIKAKVDEMKEAQPHLFGAPPATPPPGADPKRPQGGRTPKGTFGAEGAKRFENQMKRETPPVIT